MLKNRWFLFWCWTCFLLSYCWHNDDTDIMILQCVLKLLVELKIFSLFFPIDNNWFNLKINVTSFPKYSILSDLDIILLPTKNKLESSLCQQHTILLIFFTINNQSPWMTTITCLHLLFCGNDRFRTGKLKCLFSCPYGSFD